MTDKNSREPKTDNTDHHAISASASSGVWAWLFWLRHWLSCCYGGAAAVPEHNSVPAAVQDLNRARRHSHAYFERCALPPARDLGTLRQLLPRELSPTQTQERLAQISVLGRVRIYQISFWGSVLLRRAQLVCYDHGWWRAPHLRISELVCPLRPP